MITERELQEKIVTAESKNIEAQEARLALFTAQVEMTVVQSNQRIEDARARIAAIDAAAQEGQPPAEQPPAENPPA